MHYAGHGDGMYTLTMRADHQSLADRVATLDPINLEPFALMLMLFGAVSALIGMAARRSKTPQEYLEHLVMTPGTPPVTIVGTVVMLLGGTAFLMSGLELW